MSEITSFAKTSFNNQETTFGIKAADRRHHFYTVGKTGMGRTNLLENMAVQDIQSGRGMAFVDFQGDAAEKLIGLIPDERISDVVYFNLADTSFPLAFNMMENVDFEARSLVALDVIGVFKKLWADSWDTHLEYFLLNAILAVLENPRGTLSDVMKLLIDENYRKEIVGKISDPMVKSFWTTEFVKWGAVAMQESIMPIQDRIEQFLTDSNIQNTIKQPQSDFDIREVMNEGKILIVNLASKQIGENNSSLVGVMIVTKIQLAMMVNEHDNLNENRKDFYLYLDEFQNFSTESFINILADARDHNLNLILANKYVAQLDEAVQAAIFDNVKTMVSFQLGRADAEFIAQKLGLVFSADDIIKLPKYSIYLKLMIDGVVGDAFSAITLEPVNINQERKEENLHAIINNQQAINLNNELALIDENRSVASQSKNIVNDGGDSVDGEQEIEEKFSFLNELQQKNSQKEEQKVEQSTSSNSMAQVSPMFAENKSQVQLDENNQQNDGFQKTSKKSTAMSAEEFLKEQNIDIGDLKSKIDVKIKAESDIGKNQSLQEVEKIFQASMENEKQIDEVELTKLSDKLNEVGDSNNEIDNEIDKNEILNSVAIGINPSSNIEKNNVDLELKSGQVEKSGLAKKVSDKDVLKQQKEKDEVKTKTKTTANLSLERRRENAANIERQRSEIKQTTQTRQNKDSAKKEGEAKIKKDEELNNKTQVKAQAKIKPITSSSSLNKKEKDITKIKGQNQGMQESRDVKNVKEVNKLEAKEVKKSQDRSQKDFVTTCSECDVKVSVPFKPDGKRPVFCKRCLKGHQRKAAKAQNFRSKKINNKNQGNNQLNKKNQIKDRRVLEEQVYISADKPLNLSQIEHMAPKKFSSTKKNIDLNAVREMIKKTDNG